MDTTEEQLRFSETLASEFMADHGVRRNQGIASYKVVRNGAVLTISNVGPVHGFIGLFCLTPVVVIVTLQTIQILRVGVVDPKQIWMSITVLLFVQTMAFGFCWWLNSLAIWQGAGKPRVVVDMNRGILELKDYNISLPVASLTRILLLRGWQYTFYSRAPRSGGGNYTYELSVVAPNDEGILCRWHVLSSMRNPSRLAKIIADLSGKQVEFSKANPIRVTLPS